MYGSVLSDRKVSYAFAYGRVCGMEAKIVSPQVLESMFTSKTLGEFASLLDSTDYAGVLHGVDIGSRTQLDAALAASFRKSFQEVSSIIPEADSRELGLLFMSEWDAHNIKVLARRIRMNARGDDAGIVPLGLLQPKEVDFLAESSSVEDLHSHLPRGYRTLLQKAFEDYGKSKSLFDFENRLSVTLTSHWLAEVKGDLRDYVKLKVDATNILSAVKLEAAKTSLRDYVVWDGFYLNFNKLQAMAESAGSLQEVLSDTPYASMLKRAEGNLADSYFTDLEGALRSFISKEVERKSMQEPLSVYSALRFLEHKSREYRLVRAMVLGKHSGLAPEDLRRIASWIQSA